MDFGKILTEKEARELNPLALAFVGDAVQSLYVRHRLIVAGDCKAAELHKMSSATVNAGEQSRLAEKVLDMLTEEEKSVYFRGRNGKSHHKAKNQTGADYRKATGLEAVFGYLYLTGNEERLLKLLGEENENRR